MGEAKQRRQEVLARYSERMYRMLQDLGYWHTQFGIQYSPLWQSRSRLVDDIQAEIDGK
jgi:hypothetical protein